MEDWKLKPARDLELPPVERNRYALRESGLLEATTRAAWWSLVRTYLFSVHRMQVHGREHLPKEPPFVIVSNHESHLDSLAIGAALPLRSGDRTFPLAAGDLFFEKPLAAVFSAYAINALPVWRKKVGKQGLTDLKTRLIEDACIYILFPEGTRRRGAAMGCFRPGFGMFVAGTKIPVVPCWIEGTARALPPGTRCPRPARIAIHFGPPQEFSRTPDVRQGWNAISQSLEQAVRELVASRHANAEPASAAGR